MNTNILDRQSLFDLALQLHGDISTALNLAEASNLSITDNLTIGQPFQHNTADILDHTVVNLYTNRHHNPATALSSDLTSGDGAILLEGIEYWGIQYDFIVS